MAVDVHIRSPKADLNSEDAYIIHRLLGLSKKMDEIQEIIAYRAGQVDL